MDCLKCSDANTCIECTNSKGLYNAKCVADCPIASNNSLFLYIINNNNIYKLYIEKYIKLLIITVGYVEIVT